MQNGVNEEVFGDVLAAVLATFPLRFGVKKDEIGFGDSFEQVAKADIHLASHALMDIHELLDLELDYMPFTEFEKFKTIQDVVEYFYIETLNKTN